MAEKEGEREGAGDILISYVIFIILWGPSIAWGEGRRSVSLLGFSLFALIGCVFDRKKGFNFTIWKRKISCE